MTETTYAQAYTEVLEILKNLPEIECNKIPKEKIAFYQNNCDNSYNFVLKNDLSNVSQRANAIMISIYKNYFTMATQQEKLKKLLDSNSLIIEEQKREKYNPDNIFKNNVVNNMENDEEDNVDIQIIEYKQENIVVKIFNKIKSIFKKFIFK